MILGAFLQVIPPIQEHVVFANVTFFASILIGENTLIVLMTASVFMYMFTFHSIDYWFSVCPVQRGLQDQRNTGLSLNCYH